MNAADVMHVRLAWGPCPPPAEGCACAAGVDGSGVVDVADALRVLAAWGACG